MSFESDLQQLLDSHAPGHIYWDTPPDGFDPWAQNVDVFVILQQIGGRPNQYVEKDIVPSHKHARIQVTVWAKRRIDANNTARAIEDTIAMSEDFNSEVISAVSADFSREMKLRGTHQHFGFWYADN